MDEGLSFALIGAAIGMGRNSCIGKAHRLGLRPARRPGPVLIHQLEPHHCRFPLGELMAPPPYRYCGEAAMPPAPYCREHLLRVYQARGGRM